jgi:hypothetical protein
MKTTILAMWDAIKRAAKNLRDTIVGPWRPPKP